VESRIWKEKDLKIRAIRPFANIRIKN